MHSLPRNRQRRWPVYGAIFLLAVLVHGLVLVLGWLTAGWLEWGKAKRDLSYRQFQVTLEKSEKEDQPDPTKQIVTIPAPRKEERPREARFLSEYDSKVKKETQARNKRVAPRVAAAYNPEPRPVSPPTPQTPPKGQDTRKTHKDVEKQLQPTRNALRMRSTSSSKDARYEANKGRDEKKSEKKPPAKQGSEKSRQLKLSDLKLSDKQLSKAIGAPFPDHLGSVPEGKKTLLNTKRWKFSSFFNRVKRAVAQQWKPGRVYRRHDPTGNIYGFRSRLTVLKVTLDSEGNIKKVLIKKPCGLGFLDDEAVRAFKAAGPFPNPPSRLIDKKTQKIVFSFGFMFEITRGPSFRIFRYK